MATEITISGRTITLEEDKNFNLIPDFTVGDGRAVVFTTPSKYASGHSIKVKGNTFLHDVRTVKGVTDLVRPSSISDPREKDSLPSDVTPEELAFLAEIRDALDAEYQAEQAARKAAKAERAASVLAAEKEKLAGMDNVKIYDED
jgi:hypothetical protein